MVSKNPLISIICAVHNEERFIRETLETVVSQSYPNWELIIMDGASTDKTMDIVKEYAAKYENIIFRSEPDSGQWHALDKALSLARGEYISILCGQDGYLDKDWLGRCIQTFERHPEISLVWGVPINMSEDGKLLGPHYAYAQFLKDERYGSRTKPISTIVAKIDWRRPSSVKRLRHLLGKLTWSRVVTIFRSLRKQDIPQKENWLPYWLKTGRVFPEGNMCVNKEVFLRHTIRFPKEKMANVVFLDFSFDFNTNGYLAYGLPLAASFGRSHTEGQALRGYDDMLTENYYRKISDFRRKMKGKKSFEFVNSSGKIVSERVLNI